jgi:hypothetical protein
MNRNLVGSILRGPAIDASYQISVHLAKQFQRRRFFEIGQSETIIACDDHDFFKSSPKPLGQMNQNLVGSIYRRSSIKDAHFIPIR